MANRINLILSIFAAATPLVNGETGPTSGPAANAGAPAGSTSAVTEILASRLVTGKVDTQLAILRSRMSITSHDKGPFGFFQDPKRAAEQVIDLPMAKPEKLKRTPLRLVVDAIPISLVIPSQQEFMVNSRTIRTGDQFPLVVGKQSIKVRVERVRSSGVMFRDLKTGEVAEKRMELLPEGVIRSKGGVILPEGMVPAGKSSSQELVIDQTTINPTQNGGNR